MDFMIGNVTVGATINNADRNQQKRFKEMETIKINKPYYTNPLVVNKAKFVPAVATTHGTFGPKFCKLIHSYAKHINNMENIPIATMEKYIKRSLSYFIHKYVANSVINNLHRLINHKFVNPSIRHEFTEESTYSINANHLNRPFVINDNDNHASCRVLVLT